MPRTFRRTFRIRHYECDAYNVLNYAAYLGYMQETAFDAASDAGFGPDVVAGMNRQWLVRETEIEYFEPLHYGDSVEVTTWVHQFSRIMSHRHYAFRRPGSEYVVAQARTDWVFIDSENGRPVRVPEELVHAFMPEGANDPENRRPRFRRPEITGDFLSAVVDERVQYHDLDPANHANNSVYMAYLEDAAIRLWSTSGWPPSRMRETGFAPFAKRHRIKYLQQAVLDDELAIRTWFSALTETGATRFAEIVRKEDGAVLTEAIVEYVWRDPGLAAPAAPPEDFLGALQAANRGE